MHQIRFRLGVGGAYSTPPDPLAGFKGPTSKGGEGGEVEERGPTSMGAYFYFRERSGRKGRRGEGWTWTPW